MESKSRVYAQLRSWYLARLKQESAGLRATPAALIEYDRAFMERVAEASRGDEAAEQEAPPIALRYWLLCVCAVINLVCFGLFFVAAHFDFAVAWGVFTNSTWGRFILQPVADTPVDKTYVAVVAGIFFGGPPVVAALLTPEMLFRDSRPAARE